MISNRRKKQIQHEKEFKSFRKKMGSNIVWFDSLSKTKQWDLIFSWKKSKHQNKLTKPEWSFVNKIDFINPNSPLGGAKWSKVKVLEYPPSLKHFITESKLSGEFVPTKTKVREITIEMILNKSK